MHFAEGLLIGALGAALVMTGVMTLAARLRRKRKLIEEQMLLRNQLEAWVQYAMRKGIDPLYIREYYNYQVHFIKIITNPKTGEH